VDPVSKTSVTNIFVNLCFETLANSTMKHNESNGSMVTKKPSPQCPKVRNDLKAYRFGKRIKPQKVAAETANILGCIHQHEFLG